MASLCYLVFIHSFGFMGARLATFMAILYQHFCGCTTNILLETFYSIGLAIAHFHVMHRVPNHEVLWLLVLNYVGLVFYHELWPKYWKVPFWVMNAFFTYSLLSSSVTPTYMFKMPSGITRRFV